MLYRISGKLTPDISEGSEDKESQRAFASRIEASDAISAFVIGRKAINDTGVADSEVIEIHVRAVKGGKSVRISPVKPSKAPEVPAPSRRRKR